MKLRLKKKNKELQENQNPSNREFAVIAYVFAAIFVGLIAYLCVFMWTRSDDFVNNPYNKRITELSTTIIRGNIVTRDGTVIAKTNDNGKAGEKSDFKREYPHGKEYAHLVGYIPNGGAGLESKYGYEMMRSHTNTFNRIKNDISGNKLQGDVLVTTLDSRLQDIAYKALKGNYGAVIASNPESGEVLAMVSTPAYDPNTIEDDWDSIVSDPDSSVLLNRATQGLYPPGSTFKLVTLLEYIRENPENYEKYSYDCQSEYSHDGTVVHCYKGQSHGQLSLKQALAKSCNGAFAEIGLGLDMYDFRDTAESLLFNEKLPAKDILYNKSRFDLDSDSSSNKIMLSSIGQGDILVTPYHLLLIASAIENDGEVICPYFVSRVTNDTGRIIKSYSSPKSKRIMTKSEAKILAKYMRYVVKDGTASALNSDKYTACGKTGSAEFGSTKGDSHAWFIGYAKSKNHEPIAVSIVVEAGGAGSSTAVPIARELFDTYFSLE